MSEKEFELSYRYSGPVSFSSMTAQAFLHFGFRYGRDGRALWHFRVRETGGGYEAALFCGEKPFRGPVICSSRKEAAHFLMDALAAASGKPLGRWGYLLGMRPVKALYPFLPDGEAGEARAARFLAEERVEPDAAALLLSCFRAQQRLWEQEAGERDRRAALYVHIPFCPSHCLYCSFPSAVVRRGRALDRFTDALCEDIRRAGALIRKKGFLMESVYFGGGTPTVLTEEQMDRVLSAVRAHVPVEEVEEWTVEAGRPDTVNPAMLAVLRARGVDRISVNPQTMQDRILAKISRTHGAADILRAFREARAAGFRTVNMDFICGLPEQTRADMAENLRVICQLRPENVTIHTLAVKRGSPFFHREKEFSLPPEAEVEAMLGDAHRRLVAEGYRPYYLYRQKYMTDDFANVGYALEGHESVYNIQMIGEHQHVIGAGAGAASKAVLPGGFRLKKLYMPRSAAVYEADLQKLCEERDHLWDDSADSAGTPHTS